MTCQQGARWSAKWTCGIYIILDHIFVFLSWALIMFVLWNILCYMHNLDQAHMWWDAWLIEASLSGPGLFSLARYPIHVAIVWWHFFARVAILIQFHVLIFNHHLTETLEDHQLSNSAHYSCDGNTRWWRHHLDPLKMCVEAPYSGNITLIWPELRSFCTYQVQAAGLTSHIVWHHQIHEKDHHRYQGLVPTVTLPIE